MILAAAILCVLILAFCLCLRRHELVYYWKPWDTVIDRYCDRDGNWKSYGLVKSIHLEPPDGYHYQTTCTWLTFLRWKILKHSCYSMYTVNPPRHFNCRSQLKPLIEERGNIRIVDYMSGPLKEIGEKMAVIIDHEKEMEE